MTKTEERQETSYEKNRWGNIMWKNRYSKETSCEKTAERQEMARREKFNREYLGTRKGKGKLANTRGQVMAWQEKEIQICQMATQ